MTTRDDGPIGTAFVAAAAALALGGWGISAWLAGSPEPSARVWQAVLGWALLAAVVLGALTAFLRSRVGRRQERLRALVPGASASEVADEFAVVERLVIERNQAAQEVRVYQQEAVWIERAVDAQLTGEEHAAWPTAHRLATLSRRVETLISDRREDAAFSSELLGLWIERLERLQLRVGLVLKTVEAPGGPAPPKPGGGGERTGGEEPTQPSASNLAPLSRSLNDLRADLARLEEEARALRRRLGGRAAEELTDDDFMT